VFEDYLDELGVSVQGFLEEVSGGWLYGYVEALGSAGIDTVLVILSRSIRRPERRVHHATGAPTWLVPPTRSLRLVRRATSWTLTSRELGAKRGIARIVSGFERRVTPFVSFPARSVMRILRQEECAALLLQEYEEPRFDLAVLVGQLLRFPVYATFQGGSRSRTGVERVVRRWSVPRATGLIIASASEAERVRERYRPAPGRIARIFNPLDTEHWRSFPRDDARRRLGLPGDARIAAWHGRVDIRGKGLDVLVDAWAQIVSSRPEQPLRLVMVGGGRDRDALHSLIDTRRLAPSIVWFDQYVRDDDVVRMHLSAADVYALPSRHEGFAVAPMEAMACALPVVACNAPGIADLLAGGEPSGGIIVPIGDAASLARELGGLLDDPARSRQLGERARARVENALSIETVGRQLRSFLERDGALRARR
jgi:starch synthase